MPIETILILVVFTISIVWAFKTGYIKALWKGYVFSFAHGTAEDGSFVPVLKLEQGWIFRKFVAASPIGYIPISRENVPYFLSTNREGFGQRLIPLVKAVQQWKQNIYNAKDTQQTRNAYWQAAEQIQEELEKAYPRVLSSGDVEGAGGVLALRDVRENRAEFDKNTLTLSSAMCLGMAAQGLGLLSRSAYENFLDSCEGMDKENTVYLDEDVRQEIMKYVDNPKQEKKLRRRKKWASFWEYR